MAKDVDYFAPVNATTNTSGNPTFSNAKPGMLLIDLIAMHLASH